MLKSRKILPMLLLLMMMFHHMEAQAGSIPKPSVSKSIITPIYHIASYENVYSKSYEDGFNYSDAFFIDEATIENPGLSIASAYLAAQAYQEDSIRRTLIWNLGFEELEASYPTATKDYPHTIGYFIAKKRIRIDEKEFTLYAVCVRGTPGSPEWTSNFSIGQSGDKHVGFHSASGIVLNAITKLVDTPIENTMIWIMGHSRGAAIANEVAGDLCRYDFLAHPQRIYAYTYATPNGVTNPVNNNNIRNYVNLADFVTRVPLSTQWGYSKNGVIIELPNQGKVESDMKHYFNRASGHKYIGLAKWQTDIVIAQMESYAPTINDYNNPRVESVVPSSMNGIISQADFGGKHNPKAFFDALALLLGGDARAGSIGIISEVVNSRFAASIFATFVGLDVVGVVVALTKMDYHNPVWELAPIKHAHSKEAYIGYMHSMYDVASLNQVILIKEKIADKSICISEPTTVQQASATLPIISSTPNSTDENEPILQVTTKEQWPDGTLSGRVDYVSEHRATRVGVHWGETRDTLTLYDFDDLGSEANAETIEFFYSPDRIAGRGGYFQAFADVDGKRYYGEIQEARKIEPHIMITTNPFDLFEKNLTARVNFGRDAVVTEVGMYWGTSKNELTLVGADTIFPGTLTEQYLDFYYSAESPPAELFYYRAYAVINGEQHWGEIMEGKRNDAKPIPDAIHSATTKDINEQYLGTYYASEYSYITLMPNGEYVRFFTIYANMTSKASGTYVIDHGSLLMTEGAIDADFNLYYNTYTSSISDDEIVWDSSNSFDYSQARVFMRSEMSLPAKTSSNP